MFGYDDIVYITLVPGKLDFLNEWVLTAVIRVWSVVDNPREDVD